MGVPLEFLNGPPIFDVPKSYSPSMDFIPYLPVHFMYCKEVIFSIALAIGKPLQIDQAIASLARPSIGRVLMEYDVTQPPLPRI